MGSNGATSLGFLTVLQEPTGYVGGYLVTNTWGRPLEFRLSTAVQPNRVQQILYAGTLRSYLCSDLIGKALIEKTATPVQLVITDTEAALDLRHKLDLPVVWLASPHEQNELEPVLPTASGRGGVFCHPQYPQDRTVAAEILQPLRGLLDLSEPFSRIREAIVEARKAGVMSRAA